MEAGDGTKYFLTSVNVRTTA
uniref:Uncharacterized protein n=1 Tax=Anguilla anguilla TaxID=7936 RepID=A0A0E9TKS7_ANGAN